MAFRPSLPQASTPYHGARAQRDYRPMAKGVAISYIGFQVVLLAAAAYAVVTMPAQPEEDRCQSGAAFLFKECQP